jgi:hypothetical protein
MSSIKDSGVAAGEEQIEVVAGLAGDAPSFASVGR